MKSDEKDDAAGVPYKPPPFLDDGSSNSTIGWAKLSEKTYLCYSQPLKSDKYVYKGKHWFSGEWIDVAVKLVSPNAVNLSEIDVNLKLKGHQNVIRLYEAGSVRQGIIPHIYIAMELCSQTLADFIEERKGAAFDFKQHFEFAKQIISGVAFIHEFNILHRDIKLDNILLSQSKDNIRVADFGLSKQLLDERSFATASNRGLGSDGYRAPELLHDSPKASYRSDSFSLGIILAMLFSNGRHPFGPDPARWRINIMDNMGKDLSHILMFEEAYPEKRARLMSLINSCLDSNYQRRPTPTEMLQHPFFTSNLETCATPSGGVADVTDEHKEEKNVGLSIEAKNGASEEDAQPPAESNGTTTAHMPTEVKGNVDTDPLDESSMCKKRKVERIEKTQSSVVSTESETPHAPSEAERVMEADRHDKFLMPKKRKVERLENPETVKAAGDATGISKESLPVKTVATTPQPTDSEVSKHVDAATLDEDQENQGQSSGISEPTSTVSNQASTSQASTAAGGDVSTRAPTTRKLPAPPPSGPGWNKLSEHIYMCNLQPINNSTIVFKGKRLCDGEWHDIAVKLIQYNETHVKEIKLNQKLEGHPNVIQMFEAEKIDGVICHIYIAMELCSQTLKGFLDERKNMPFDFDLHFDIAKQILSGIVYIHQNQIIHRDIKLENILLSQSKDSIRIADFGMSTQLNDGYSVATASFRGIGSDAFRAPELLNDKPKASYRSDSFSLGVVLAMLFSNGRHPFGPNPTRWRSNMMDNKCKDLSHVVKFKEPYAYKRAQLLELIEKCLRPNPQQRPTPKEMLQHAFFTSTSETPSVAGPSKAVTTSVPASLKKITDVKASRNLDLSQLAAASPGVEDRDTSGFVYPLDDFLTAKNDKIKTLENQLGVCLRNSEIERYSLILEELKNLRKSDDLELALQLAEYELMSKRNDSPIRKLCDFVISSGSQSALEVVQMAIHLHQTGQNIQGMMLFKIGYDLHKRETKFPPGRELKWIVSSVSGITTTLDPLFKQGGWARDFAKNFAVAYMEEMLADLRAVEGASPGEMALYEVGCIVNIIGTTNEIRDHETTIKYGEEGVAKMQQEFGDGVVYYKSYGGVMNNMGNAYSQTGQREKAQACYLAAIETHMKALDYESEELRQKHIRHTRSNLDN